jgi:imidazolonepropionase-like amidohydrolase
VAETVIRGGTLLDGTGRDPRPDVAVVIDGQRIASVGKGAKTTKGADLDCTGLTVLPGLIDAHTHLGVVDVADDGTKNPIAVTAARIFAVARRALHAGFTTVRDAGGVDGGLAKAIDMGLVEGPRVLPSGPILCQSGGHGDLRSPWMDHHHAGLPGLVRISAPCDGADALRAAARDAFRRGATQLKVCVSGGIISVSDHTDHMQLSTDELRAVVAEAEARGSYVMAHAHGLQGIRNALEAGVRSFEHASFLDGPTAAAVAAAGGAIVPTLAVAHLMSEHGAEWGVPEWSRDSLAQVSDGMAQATKLAYDAGVRVGSGSDLLGPDQDRRGLELVLKARLLGPMAAIVSATAVNADIIGLGHDTGTVESGKRADLIALDGDPLEEPELFDDPSRVVLVVKAGQVVKDTRATRAALNARA